MLGILLINLLWVVLDGLFETNVVQSFLAEQVPSFVVAYQPIHDNFLFVDLAFVTVFLSEFFLRWGVSVARKEHLRWYFFPFIHWYDLVGCIPLATTRIFRVLRVVSIVYRLHKYKIIDLNSTAVFRFFKFYADVFVEELSDRIVVKVISDAQKDISMGTPLVSNIQQQVLAPRLPIVSRYIANILNHFGDSILDSEHGAVIREHVQSSVGKAVRNNAQVSAFSLLPVVGNTIENTMESAVTDIVTQSIINLLSDIDDERVKQFMRDGLTDFTPEDEALEHEMMLVVNECLELIKAHVSQQRWKSELT